MDEDEVESPPPAPAPAPKKEEKKAPEPEPEENLTEEQRNAKRKKEEAEKRVLRGMLMGSLQQRYSLVPQRSDQEKDSRWDDALERITTQLVKITADESFWYFSGRSSNEAGFLLQLMARLCSTNNVNNCSCCCHQASGVGLSKALGTGTATVTSDDLETSDLDPCLSRLR